MPKIKDLLQEAQGIVLGSPTYWYNVTADMKNLIDRLYSLIIFPEDDRSVWASAFDGRGKCGIGVVVCEQEDEKMMGFTMEAMTRALNDLDIKVSDVVKAIGYFKSAEVLQDKELMDRAEIAGQRLVRNIRLKEKARILRG